MDNIFHFTHQLIDQEIFETIVNSRNVKIERIISTGQTTPKDSWYDQEQDEWVILLQGQATLLFLDNSSIKLKSGDYLLIGSLFSVERAGNVLISFNNYPVKKAIPFLEQLDIENYLNLEFTPSPDETKLIIEKDYLVRRNLLVKFTDDNIDETKILEPILDDKYPNLIALQTLSGNHLTPLSQDIKWEAGEIFTPLDAVGQWVKQAFSRDLYRLKNEILRWLNPGRIV